MKKIIFLLLIAGCFAQPIYAQSKKPKKVKPYYVVIDDASFTNTKSDRGAKLTGYYINDSISRMESWTGFASGDIRREFFYWRDTLLVVTETHRLYNPNTTTPIDSIKPTYNARYVFVNGKINDIKQKGSFSFTEIPSDKKTQEAMYLSISAQYVEALNKARAIKENRIKLKKKDMPENKE